MTEPPLVTRKVLEALVGDLLPRDTKNRKLILVHGRYLDGPGDFVLPGAARRRVHVTDQPSVLGIVEAWQHHVGHRSADDVLVVTTGVDHDQLGWDLRAYAVRGQTQTVDGAQIVAHRFGAVDVDPRIRQENWLLDALLEIDAPEGWSRDGSVLTRDSAVRAVIGARLGGVTLKAVMDGVLDARAMVEWSLEPHGPDRFAELPVAEQAGLSAWLQGVVGDVAPVVLSLAADGRARDAMPLGVVAAAVVQPKATTESALAFGGLLRGVSSGTVQKFAAAVEASLDRWVAEVASGSARGEIHRQALQDVLRRADELAGQANLSEALTGNRFLYSGFTTRMHAFAKALTGRPSATSISRMERALAELRGHTVAALEPNRYRAAEMATRLVRWTGRPSPEISSTTSGIRHQQTDGGWVDRALSVLWAGDEVADPILAKAYRTVYEAAVARRDAVDEQFSAHLASWVRHPSSTEPAGCLLIEDVLDTVAVPVNKTRAPLILVLDGMSAAVATELGEQLGTRGWIEVAPQTDSRLAAITTFPSVTTASRASLLAGRPIAGGQDVEREGFTAFWRKHHREASLFYKGDLAGSAGNRLADPLITALAGDGVVGVVLNTIDEALDHGRPGDRVQWSVQEITYLSVLLDAARGYGRPVVLVSDHGHVLDHAPNEKPTSAEGVESARWRTGVPAAGEVELTGPRVLLGGGAVVVPWQHRIRYTPRKFGYHGGAALAEVTVPVLVLMPSSGQLPHNWQAVSAEAVTPPWWDDRPQAVQGQEAPKPAKANAKFDAPTLFAQDTLGTLVVGSDAYQAQRMRVPKPPDPQAVAAVLDALVAAGGVLTLSAVATVAGRAARRPEAFAVMLQRLINVDGYPVLSIVDGSQRLRLDVEVLRVQFGVQEA
ncbi:BREX-2 system phosphatase PglZ [Pseudonocardiaceae bacterium YIM PH 21723]|nr:BREX-2 system phosphatase PglZ [Pseudonocardiaceae bacterium YIM PH 21723]